jgi:putative hydroxymethylpyrimidine transport system substrate-binding protein
MPARTQRILLAVALLAATVALAACGEKSEDVSGKSEPFDLALDFYPNPDHAGIYLGQKLGYFRDAGLDLKIATPTNPADPIKQVAAGRADLAISYEPEVILAREQGLDVVAVGALVNKPLTSMIWLGGSGIAGVGGLRGKTIATAGIPYQQAFLQTILARANLSEGDVNTVNVGLGLLPALLSGKAQAMLGGFRNIEGVDLALRGKAPQVTPVDQLGVPSYDELVLVAQGQRLQDDPEAIRLFIAALARGTAAAEASPGEATQAVLGANDALDPKVTAAEVKATLPLLQMEKGKPYGYMDPKRWKTFVGWMRDNGLIASLPAPSELLSNDYLPGMIPE